MTDRLGVPRLWSAPVTLLLSVLVVTTSCTGSPSGPPRSAAPTPAAQATAGGATQSPLPGLDPSALDQCPSWESVAAVGGRKVTSLEPRKRQFLTDPDALACSYTGSGRNTEITVRNTVAAVPAENAELLRTQHRAGLAAIAGDPVAEPPPGLGALSTRGRGECTVVAYSAAGPSPFVLVDAFQTDGDATTLCEVALRLAAARLAGTVSRSS
ncbi:MAG: hypothetical protein M3Z02_06065 [Actinomycetota bacterium]|nr:hypothetical protein [Actinomycetota bacterium]